MSYPDKTTTWTAAVNQTDEADDGNWDNGAPTVDSLAIIQDLDGSHYFAGSAITAGGFEVQPNPIDGTTPIVPDVVLTAGPGGFTLKAGCTQNNHLVIISTGGVAVESGGTAGAGFDVTGDVVTSSSITGWNITGTLTVNGGGGVVALNVTCSGAVTNNATLAGGTYSSGGTNNGTINGPGTYTGTWDNTSGTITGNTWTYGSGGGGSTGVSRARLVNA